MYYANIDKNNFLICWLNDEVHSKEMIPNNAKEVTEEEWINAVSINANFYDEKTSRFVRKEKPRTKDQEISEANEKKNNLINESVDKITPLQYAVDLEMATDDEAIQLEKWKKYRVLLNRVDTSLAPDIDWPQKP